MKLIVSIAPRSMKEARSILKAQAGSRDLVEIRIDRMKNPDMEKLLRSPRPHVIITNRHRAEGGWFRGSAEEQVRILSSALASGAEYVDIELRWGIRQIKRLLSAGRASRVIVSHHDTKKTPPDLRSILKRLCATPARNLKLVTSANDISDNKKIFDLLRGARNRGRRISAFCMYERGQVSRILGGKYGSAYSYASSGISESTAPGQLSAADLREIFRVENINRNTRVFGLVGNPVSQSQGFRHHNEFFSRNSLNAVYVTFLVDDLRRFFKAFRDEISGLSITMPFKRDIIPFIDHVEEDALILQSVNTVVARRGALSGCNTDYLALRKLLRTRTKPRGKRAIVLGTGGTSSSMAFAARNAGARTTIVGRSIERARALASRLDCSWASFEDLPDLAADILMNGTPVGMSPRSNESPVPRRFLRRGMTVLDAVHYPPMTLLLRNAKAAGCNIISGSELFTEQARLQSKLFLEVC